MLTELVGDKSLERFRQEYEKLHRALKKSHESEKRLIKKCRELNAEIVSNASKVQTALKLSQEDQVCASRSHSHSQAAATSHSQATAATPHPTLALTNPFLLPSLSFAKQNTIASLKREIEKAWKMVDVAREGGGRKDDRAAQDRD